MIFIFMKRKLPVFELVLRHLETVIWTLFSRNIGLFKLNF